MLMYMMIYGCYQFTIRVSRYDLYSTLHFAAGGVATRRNRAGYYSTTAPALFYLRPSMASFSSRLASHKMQRTLQAVQLRSLG